MVHRNNTHKDPLGSPDGTGRITVSGTAIFGPFRLRAAERSLEREGTALKIGSRAFDILVTLLQSAPEIVSNRELMSRAWGSLVVDEGSLRFQIATLRKTLGDAPSGAPYITNIPGRGYCFAAAVSWMGNGSGAGENLSIRWARQLPRRPVGMIGRDSEVANLAQQLREQRFVSIVGAGGIGKTTVALAVAHEVFAEFGGAVQFLDLATLRDPQLVSAVLTAQLGLTVVSDNALPVLLNYVRERRILLVLDNCEHLIEAVATLAETLFNHAPEVHILATSRESLRAEGERVHHLPSLRCPPPDALALTASEALAFPAVQLFVEQATATGYPFELHDHEVPIVAELCRRLDGIALALELAASRVGVYGLQRIASLLDDQFRLLWRGRRTALPRHQTLGATLDWSYNLLSRREQLVLRCLAVFVGAFSLEDAVAIAGEGVDSAEVTEIIAALVEKSLLTLDPGVSMRYRLLDTTRAYAQQRLKESGEEKRLAQRHCTHLCISLEHFRVAAALTCGSDAVTFFSNHLSQVHAALEWSFSVQGEAKLGIRLSAVCAPLYLQLSLLPECVACTERALNALDPASRGTRFELELQVCFALALLYSKGNDPAVRTAIERGLHLAQQLHEATTWLLLLYQLTTWQVRGGDYRGLPEITERFAAVAEALQDPLADAIAHVIVAITCFYSGELREVPRLTRAALACPAQPSKLSDISFDYVHKTGVRNVLARSLWLLGYPDQALVAAEEAVKEAVDLGHPRTMANVLAAIVFVYLATGEWATAETLSERLLALVAKHRLATFAPVGIGWRGSLEVLRGDPLRGTELLQSALIALRSDGYQLYTRPLSAALAEGYAKSGQQALARATIDEAIAWSEKHGPSVDLLELLRVKGEILTSCHRSDIVEGEDCLLRSLELARQKSLLSVELRSGMSLARLWAGRGLARKALDLLASIHGRFVEGFGTRDLVTAANLLTELRARATSGS